MQWYKENRALKRQSAVILQKYLEASPNGFSDDLSSIKEDENEKLVDEELVALQKTNKSGE